VAVVAAQQTHLEQVLVVVLEVVEEMMVQEVQEHQVKVIMAEQVILIMHHMDLVQVEVVQVRLDNL
jgi:hypothetical protein